MIEHTQKVNPNHLYFLDEVNLHHYSAFEHEEKMDKLRMKG
jgi:hypothetical protein